MKCLWNTFWIFKPEQGMTNKWLSVNLSIVGMTLGKSFTLTIYKKSAEIRKNKRRQTEIWFFFDPNKFWGRLLFYKFPLFADFGCDNKRRQGNIFSLQLRKHHFVQDDINCVLGNWIHISEQTVHLALFLFFKNFDSILKTINFIWSD